MTPAVALAAEDAMDVANERATLDFLGMAKEEDSLEAMPDLLLLAFKSLALDPPSNQLFLAVLLLSLLPPISCAESSACPDMRPVVFLEAPIEMPVMISATILPQRLFSYSML